MKYSILLPVYNAEKYLKSCIESVLAQKIKDYELIIIDDGSTDDSSSICTSFEQKYPQVRFYKKNNEGVLLAREYAISKSSGEYIIFIDADDFWSENFLEVIEDALDLGDFDLVLFRYNRIKASGEFLFADNGVFENHKTFSEVNKDILLKTVLSTSRLNTVWSKCVKASILKRPNDYARIANRYGEDFVESFDIIYSSKKIFYIDDAIYWYRLSEGGQGRNFKPKYLNDYEAIRAYIYERISKEKLKQPLIDAFYQRYVQGLIALIETLAFYSETYNDFKLTMKEVFEYPTLLKSIDSITDCNKCEISISKLDLYDLRAKRTLRFYLVNKVKGKVLSLFKT